MQTYAVQYVYEPVDGTFNTIICTHQIVNFLCYNTYEQIERTEIPLRYQGKCRHCSFGVNNTTFKCE